MRGEVRAKLQPFLACEDSPSLHCDYCAAERELNPLTAPQTRRVGRLLRFPSCHALVADGTAYVEYGRFPLIPGEPSAAVGERPEFRATYVGAVQLLPADEAALLPPLCSVTADAPFVAAPGSRGARLWEASFDTSDAVVDATLGELGRALPLLRRVDDGTMRQAFRQLAATAIRGYREADTAGRDAKLRRLIALPRMHLRRLVGTATRRVREQHAMQQLSGAVCEQGVAVAPAHGSRRRAAPSDAELDALCVRSAYKLAAEGLVGRAAADEGRARPPRSLGEKLLKESHELFANLMLLAVGAHVGYLLLFRRPLARFMLFLPPAPPRPKTPAPR